MMNNWGTCEGLYCQ